MDYKITQDSIFLKQTLFDENTEQPIDIEFSMPDYFPDIQRILKCCAKPVIFSKQLSSDGLSIDGRINICLYYYDIDSILHCCEHSQPFSVTMHPDDIPQSPMIHTKCSVDYVNCRATTGRRVDIHGAFTVFVKIIGSVSECIIADADGEGIQPLYCSNEVSSLIGSAERGFTVEEVLEISQGKPGANSILRTQANVSLTDVKQMQNKIIAKGELNIKALYCADDESDSIESMEYSLPVSQILDIDGVDEDTVCFAHIDVISCDIDIGNDSSGENRLFECSVKLSASASAYAQNECRFVCDAFSTKYGLITETHTIPIERVIDIVNTEHMMRSTVEAPDSGISRIIDMWSEEPVCKADMSGGNPAVDIEMKLCLLALDEQNVPVYFERQLRSRYEYPFNEAVSQLSFPVFVDPYDISYNFNGDKNIDIRCIFKISGILSKITMKNSICEIKIDESSPKQKNISGTLCVYYPEKNERIFDIARAYNTSMQSIIKENSLDEDNPEISKIILIPLV